MKFGDIVKCPDCGSIIKETSISIKKISIRNDSDQDYFIGDEEKLCRKTDNVFAKGYCDNCKKSFELMITVNIEPIKCYSADSRSELVMMNDDKTEDIDNGQMSLGCCGEDGCPINI